MSERFLTVDAYLAALPEGQRAVLSRVRAAIRRALPDALEGISYEMPTYKIGKLTILQFAAWKEHYGIYGRTADLVEHFGDELADCGIEKGTIRFSIDKPVPEDLIERIARFRAGRA